MMDKWKCEIQLIPRLNPQLTEGYEACAYPARDGVHANVRIIQHGAMYAFAKFTNPEVKTIPRTKRDQVARVLFNLWRAKYGY